MVGPLRRPPGRVADAVVVGVPDVLLGGGLDLRALEVRRPEGVHEVDRQVSGHRLLVPGVDLGGPGVPCGEAMSPPCRTLRGFVAGYFFFRLLFGIAAS